MKEAIRKFIVQEFLFGRGTVQDDERLFEKGIIDSLGFMKLLAFVNEKFGITLDMSEISLDKFGSLSEIVQFLDEKMGPQKVNA